MDIRSISFQSIGGYIIEKARQVKAIILSPTTAKIAKFVSSFAFTRIVVRPMALFPFRLGRILLLSYPISTALFPAVICLALSIHIVINGNILVNKIFGITN